MPAPLVEDWDSPPIDPDDLKMPESPRHRRATDVIGLAAASLLGDAVEVFRDMNWYPPDGGNALAPDVMVLPAGAWVPPPGTAPDEILKSYRQDRTGGPAPLVAVEVPSASDGFVGLLDKAGRCLRLGTVVYIASAYGQPSVLRFEPDPDATFADPSRAEQWADRPIPELGGIRIGFEGDELVVTLPDGTAAISDQALLADAHQRATAAEHRAADAEHRAVDAEHRAAELADRLREAGIDPDA